MGIRIRNTLIILLVFVSCYGYGQSFELILPNPIELKQELRSRQDYIGDVIYLYLLQNYKPISDQVDKRNYDFPDYSICAFTQKFESNIIYTTEHCKEGGGTSSTLVLPKTNRKNLENWIEHIFKSGGMGIPHDWNDDRTKFKPVDSGAGCYYEIVEEGNQTKVESYCGC